MHVPNQACVAEMTFGQQVRYILARQCVTQLHPTTLHMR